MSETLQLKPQCCGNCTHWKKVQRWGRGNSASGECQNQNNARPSEMSGHSILLFTLDLTICTNWEHVHKIAE